MKKTICINCAAFVDYELKKTTIKKKIKGIEIEYIEKSAYCKKCGQEVWVSELDDYNVLAPYEAYCRSQGLICVTELKELLNKYDIGQKPLSLLLGWSEVTITRYLAGQIPTKIYSDKLKSLNDINEFAKILEKGKDKKTNTAYVKAIKQIEMLRSRCECSSLLSFKINDSFYNNTTWAYFMPQTRREICVQPLYC